MACQRTLAAGQIAVRDRVTGTVTCIGCDPGPTPDEAGRAGASAQREYEYRHAAREQNARDKLGVVGVLLARAIDEPQSTKAWQQGARGEIRTARRLEKHLDGSAVRLLHDRRVPGHGKANIDHLAIGPGGITVIDSKTHKGAVRVDRIGGLFAPRRSVLLIGGRDRTGLIGGVETQIGYVRSALRRLDPDNRIEIRGTLCFPNPDGLPLLGQLSIRDIIIDGPKAVANSPAAPVHSSRPTSRQSGATSLTASRQPEPPRRSSAEVR